MRASCIFPIVQVSLLGPFQVHDGDRRLALGGPRERAVLALLAVQPGRAVAAERIIDALWGDHPPKTALKTLQTYVSRLRREVGPPLRTLGAGYALDVEPEAVDALSFAAEVESARRLVEEGHLEKAETMLDGALARWRSDPLAEFSFSAVLVAEATRLAELYVAAREAAARTRLALGRDAEVVAELRVLLEEHPLREQLWHDLIVALYRTGRQADALRAFQRARRTLVDELGIEPGPALRDLEARVLAQDESLRLPKAIAILGRTSDAPYVPAPLAALHGDSFVGRHAEVEAIRDSWRVVERGGFAIELLAGEPGIGKSMLAARVATQCAADGGTVLYGRCDEERLVPYQPFVETIRQHVRKSPRERVEQMTAVASDAVRLIPELRVTTGDTSPRWPTADAPDRLALFEGVAALLRLTCRDRPCVLVIDDLHWADAGTLLLLRHLVGTSDVPQLLIVATYRDTELRRDHPLAETLGLLRRDRRVTRRVVQPLDESDISELITSATGGPPRDLERIARLVHAETGGNPLFARELVRHLDESSWTADSYAIPEGVRDVIGRRLARLASRTNAVLAVAAVVGQHFDARIVARAAGESDEAVVEHLEEARRAGLVAEDQATTYRYSFSHAIVRTTLYDELGPSRRVRVHQAVAAAYEHLDRLRRWSSAAIAHHLIEAAQAPDATRAARFARDAGRMAFEQLAFEDAAASFRQALEVLELVAEPDARLQSELLIDIGRALLPVDFREAAATLWHVVETAEDAGLPSLVADAAIELVGLRPHGDPDTPEMRLLRRSIEALDPVADTTTLTRAQARLVVGSSSTAPRAELLQASGEALVRARAACDDLTLGEALVARLFTLTLPTDADERLSLSGELLRLAHAARNGGFAVHGHRFRAAALLERGDADAAWREAALHRELARQRRDLLQLEFAGNVAVSEATAHGRFADAFALMDELAALHAQTGLGAFSPLILHSHRMVIAWLRRDSVDELAGMPFPEPIAHAAAAAVHALSGRTDDALSAARKLLHDGIGLPENWGWSGLVFLLAVAAHAIGDPALISEVRRELEPHAGRCLALNGRTFFGAVDHHLGLLAAASGDADTARTCLRRAIEQYGRMNLSAWTERAGLDAS